MQWHTFLGSFWFDYGYSIAADGSGNIYVAGESHDAWGAPIRPFSGIMDAFVFAISGAGAVQHACYLPLIFKSF